MTDWFETDGERSLERKSVLPGTGFFIPRELHRERELENIEATVEGASTVVVADPDADGLAATAIVREAEGEAALVPASPHDLSTGLERAATYGEDGATVFVCDLCPDDLEEITAELAVLQEQDSEIRWFDHHQWEDAVATAVREADIELVVGDSDAECTADVAVRALDTDLPAHLHELAEVTRDHDLWIKDDPRSDDLADYAYWIEDETEYVDTVATHGPDLPPEVEAYLAERRVEKEALIERAVQRAELREIRDWTVGVTYGRCSQNEVAEALREQGADAAVIVKPSGSASIRGTESFERCHEVARQVGGGGHPKAAGCKPALYDDALDYAQHWVTRGRTTKRVILDGFYELDVQEPAPE